MGNAFNGWMEGLWGYNFNFIIRNVLQNICKEFSFLTFMPVEIFLIIVVAKTFKLAFCNFN